MEKKMRVASYARVSTDKSDQINSFESQVKYFSDYIKREENWEFIKVYSDEGVSGTNIDKRCGFKQMLADAYAGNFDLILTKEVSRFARNTLDSLGYTRELAKHNVFVIFTLDNIDTRHADAELRLTIMAALAQEESRKISERVKWGQKRQMEKGVVFGRSMLGYRVENGKLYVVEEEAETVKLIFHKYLVEGKGTHIISRELKEAGIRPYNPDGRIKYNNEWNNSVILRVLKNEKYVGDLCQKKTWTKNFLDHKKRYNKGEEDFVYIKDHHPEIAIVNRKIWDATQKELQRRSSLVEKRVKYSARHWASGKIICGCCGSRFVSKVRKTKSVESRSWVCMNRAKAAEFRQCDCTLGESANDKSLINCCLYVLKQMVKDKKHLIKELHNEILLVVGHELKTCTENVFKDKLKKAEIKKDRLIDLRLSQNITYDEFKKQKERLDAEISLLNGQISLLEENSEKEEQRADRIKKIVSEIDRIIALEDECVGEILSDVVDKIVVKPNHTADIFFKGVPYGFSVKYKSKGKLNEYRTEILSCDII